jgi:polysaccharide biosynthesis protein PslG
MPSASTHYGNLARRAPARRLGALAACLLVAAIFAWPINARAAPVPREFFGVSAVEPDASDFQRMGEARVGTYRVPVAWPGVQASANGPFNWSVPDREIAGAAANGVQPFPVLYGSPRFAGRAALSPPLDSGRARKGWKRFVAAAVRRYGPGGEFWAENPQIPPKPVTEWQIWNEQNAQHFWRRKPSPRRYAALLRLASAAIKGVDPSAGVVLGGMFGFPNGPRSIDLKDFLKRLYRVRSARKHFDAVAVHPYGGTLRLLRYQVHAARRIMDRNGDKAAPIWVTETGWSTNGPRKWPLVTTLNGQAKLLQRSFGLLLRRRSRWGIERVVWFAWRDFKQDLCRWCGGAGLLKLNGDPKPAWSLFKGFTAGTVEQPPAPAPPPPPAP